VSVRRLRLDLGYDGTDFRGWAAQPGLRTVQGEVEAALDDRNLSRLLQVIGELGERSQLIVVTHQKRTMQIAETLYGVSMRGGVSTVLSQQMEELRELL